MKKKNIRISANEVNRYVYCPYQWYYGRIYGQKMLKEKYQALDRKTSGHEANFKKGLRFHENYYKKYRLKRRIECIILMCLIGLLIGSFIQWFM